MTSQAGARRVGLLSFWRPGSWRTVIREDFILLAKNMAALIGAALCIVGASLAGASPAQALPASAFGEVVAAASTAAPATELALRSRRARWGRANEANRAPRFGFGAGLAAWEPQDAGASDAMFHGYVRGYLNEATALQVEVGYWSHGEEVGQIYVAGRPSTQAYYYGKLRDVPVGASLLYFLTPQARGRRHRGGGASLYGGFGVAWHNWTESIASGGPIPIDWRDHNSRTAFAYHYIAGLELGAFTGGKLFGEYRYTVGRVSDLGGVPLKFDGASVGGGIGVSF